MIKSAKKKLRKDRKREKHNAYYAFLLKKLIKKAKVTPTEKNIREAIKTADKIVAKKIIHKNKAARIKSKLTKLLKKKATPKTISKKTIK